MRPLLSAIPKLSLVGIADVRILPSLFSFSCRRKGCDAMYDEPVLTHRFLVKSIARRLPISSYTQTAVMEVMFSSVRMFTKW
jgi:hypothetical protein